MAGRMVALGVLALVLAGCSGGGGGASGDDRPEANAGLGEAPAATTPARDVREVSGSFQFVTPSKNIGCYMFGDSVRCDIVAKAWNPPPRPQDCELDWGTAVTVDASGEAAFTCAGDTVLGGSDVLEYGRAVRVGDFVCDSESARLRCRNESSGHGFTLSREEFGLY